MKTCTCCQTTKALDLFYRTPTGTKSVCKACSCAKAKAYSIANREQVAVRDKAYREANKERIRERVAAYRKANPEKFKMSYDESTNSLDALRSVIHYDQETGHFKRLDIRQRKTGNVFKSGRAAGYFYVTVLGVRYAGHRLAWALTTGEWPPEDVDHINGIKSDNRFANLRACTRQENIRCRGITSLNTSGFKGVSWHNGSQKWRVFICLASRSNTYLGSFDTAEEGHAAYVAAAKKHFGEYAGPECIGQLV